MKLPLQITLRDIAHSDAVETRIREKAEKLDHLFPNIMSNHVVVEMPGKHKHQGKQFSVHLDIKVPGGEVIVSKEMDEDVYVVLRDAFDAAKRQLEEHTCKQRGEVKQHAVI
ncbi:MAG: ribosome-associated translation inhibitor RaiA [Hydrogenophilales bacterium]|nr:ribosome-associated translation inhibitor RaiA [Hydrogenophilales bacterium]